MACSISTSDSRTVEWQTAGVTHVIEAPKPLYRENPELPQGEVIAECSIQTSEGVKVADIAWASTEFINEFAYKTPYPKAPEICVEIVSPSNYTGAWLFVFPEAEGHSRLNAFYL